MSELPATQLANTNQSSNSSVYTQAAWPAKRNLLSRSLQSVVTDNEKQNITTSVIAYDRTDNKTIYSHNVDFQHFAASTQKVPIAWLVIQDINEGKISLDTQLTWTASDQRAGAGVYDQPGAATTGTVRDVLYDMLNKSSNTAVRVMVNNVLGGAEQTNTRLASYPDLKVTRLQPLGDGRFYVGYTTARESFFIFSQFFNKADPATTFAKQALATNIFDDYGPRSQILDRNKMTVYDKQGMLNDPEGNNRHDIGVIKNNQTGHEVQYSLFTTSPGETEDLIAPAETSLQKMGREMLSYDGDTATQPKQNAKKASPKPADSKRIVY